MLPYAEQDEVKAGLLSSRDDDSYARRSSDSVANLWARLKGGGHARAVALAFVLVSALLITATRTWGASGLSEIEEMARQQERLFFGVLNRTEVRVFPPPPVLSKEDEDYVAICVSVKDQVFDLPEWFRHHYYHLGIRNFYLFDDGTEPPLADQLSTFELGIPRSAVHHLYYTNATRSHHERNRQQLTAYAECARMYASRHKWLAFIDVDEFIETPDPSLSLQSFLRPFEDKAGAVAMNWITHTSNNLTERPPRGAVRSAFTTCIVDPQGEDNLPRENAHVKLFARPEFYLGLYTPHDGVWKDGRRTLGEDGDVREDPQYWRMPPTRNFVALHHYVTKSKDEYAEKMLRGSGMNNHKGWDFWDEVEAKPTMTCDSLAKYTP